MASGTEQEWTTRKLIAWMSETFSRRQMDAPRLQAEMLMAHVLGCDRLRLYMDADRAATPIERQTLRDLVGRALKDEPLDYLIGERYFFGLAFKVSRDVLVPRPSTEAIVEQVLLNVRARSGAGAAARATSSDATGSELPPARSTLGEGLRIADVCTGSGCIVIALLKNLPGATAIATDVSPAALAVCRANAERHKVLDRLELLEGHLLEPLLQHPTAPGARDGAAGFHYLVSNPPYIPDDEWADVPANVRNYEPELALRGGSDGLQCLSPLLDGAPGLVRPDGQLLLETAASTAQTVLQLAKAHPLLDPNACRVVKDLEGLDRVVVATRRG